MPHTQDKQTLTENEIRFKQVRTVTIIGLVLNFLLAGVKISISIILLISLMVFYFSGFLGILILITATGIGLIPTLLNVGRHNSMGCLLVPVILYFIL